MNTKLDHYVKSANPKSSAPNGQWVNTKNLQILIVPPNVAAAAVAQVSVFESIHFVLYCCELLKMHLFNANQVTWRVVFFWCFSISKPLYIVDEPRCFRWRLIDLETLRVNTSYAHYIIATCTSNKSVLSLWQVALYRALSIGLFTQNWWPIHGFMSRF